MANSFLKDPQADLIPYEIAETILAPRMTPEFLRTLLDAIRLYGNGGDLVAMQDLAIWCHRVAGVPPPAPQAMTAFFDS